MAARTTAGRKPVVVSSLVTWARVAACNVLSSARWRSPGGSTSTILAEASRAPRASSVSPRCPTQRRPRIIASISSSVNISGGSVKPAART
jgi:hypothetical protein